MSYAYSPDTGELIEIESPLDWMGTTDIAPPAFDSSKAGCFWRADHWEIVVSTPALDPAYVLAAGAARKLRQAAARQREAERLASRGDSLAALKLLNNL